MSGPSGEGVTEWAGGSLSELISVLSAAALPARIQVFAPGPGGMLAGEVHLLAGGLSEASAGAEQGQEAVSALQRVTSARFVIDTRLPDPETGSLAKPGPAEGDLAQRPLVEIMRYCEQYVLTCTLEVWRGEEEARISYRRGELVGTTVGGSDAPERLPEVMGWKEGFFEIVLPPPVTPPVPALSKRSTASMAVAGAGATAGPAGPPSGERVRRKTDPFITVDAVKKSAPTRPAGALRPTGEGGPKLPPGPPLPGLQARIAAATPARPAQAAEPRAAPSGPAPAFPLLAPPVSKAVPSPAPGAAAAAPARTAQAPVAAPTAPEVPPARPLATPAIVAQAAATTPAAGPTAPVPDGGKVTPAPPAAAKNQPVARIPARVAQAPLATPRVATPMARDARVAAASSRAPLPSLAARTSGAQVPARPKSVPAPTAAASPVTLSPGSAAGPPRSSLPASLLAGAPVAPVRRTAPAPAAPPSTLAASAAAGQQPGAASRPSQPAEPPSPSAIRGASTTAADVVPSALNNISGEIERSATSVHGTEERPFGVELSQDMQDPAAFVDTPPPQQQPVITASRAQSTPTPVSLRPQPEEQPTERIKGLASVRPENPAVDIEGRRVRPGKRRAPRGVADWPLLVHVLLGVALGAAIVVAYSAYYGLPIP